jgi:hypothetical protein
MYGRRGQPPLVYLRLPSDLPNFLSTTFPPSFLPTFPPSCLPHLLPSCLPAYLPVFLPTFHLFCLPSFPPFCQPSCLPPPAPYTSEPACLRLQPLTRTTGLEAAVGGRFGRWGGVSGRKSMVGGTFKTLVQKVSYPCKLNYFTANTFDYFTANIKTIST